MNKRIFILAGAATIATLWAGLWWMGQTPPPENTTPPPRKRTAQTTEQAQGGVAAPRGTQPNGRDAQSITTVRLRRPATGGLELVRTDAVGKTVTESLNYYGDGLPGFVPVKESEPLRVRFVWPYPDKMVTVTRMDGGTLAGEQGLPLTVPVSATGQVEFDFQIGAEPGRYQLELMGRSGGVEAFGFWAGEVTGAPMPASDLVFVDPPLRKKK